MKERIVEIVIYIIVSYLIGYALLIVAGLTLGILLMDPQIGYKILLTPIYCGSDWSGPWCILFVNSVLCLLGATWLYNLMDSRRKRRRIY